MTDMSISFQKPTIPFTFPLIIHKKMNWNQFNWPTTFNCSIALALTQLLGKKIPICNIMA